MRDVVDPELMVNVVDLGLVYGIHLDDDLNCTIDMTLTSPTCPLTDRLEYDTQAALYGLVNSATINWVWLPPWTLDAITDDGRERSARSGTTSGAEVWCAGGGTAGWSSLAPWPTRGPSRGRGGHRGRLLRHARPRAGRYVVQQDSAPAGAVSVLLGRSDASIEFKHANISAALVDLGFQYIDGYKPRFNYQELLADVVERRLRSDDALRELARASAERPTVVPEVDDVLGVLTDAPRRAEASRWCVTSDGRGGGCSVWTTSSWRPGTGRWARPESCS